MLSEGEKDIINKLERIKVNITGKIYNFESARILNLINNLQKENEKLKTEKQLLEFQEKQLKNYIEELKKHDYRNIQIDEENEIKSPSFTKEQLDLMNLGIALYIGIPKLLEDEDESEDIDI